MATVIEWETRTCRSFNQLSYRPAWNRVFTLASRLGDGGFWFAVMILLMILHGLPGVYFSIRMLLCGLAGVVVYKITKALTARPRPCDEPIGLNLTLPAPDRYSFPSGHTLHAVCFSILIVHFEPWLAPVVVPVAVLVACSRLVLGLHYPSDVFAGVFIGTAIALIGLTII